MAKELVLEVVARKNSRDLNALADDFEKLANKSDAAGKSLGKTTTFSQHLDDQIAKTRATVKELGVEFDRTGDKDVFAKLRGAQANLRSLEGIRKQLTSALSIAGDEGAKSFWQRFSARGESIGKYIKDDFGMLAGEGILGTLGNVLKTPAGGAVLGVIAAETGTAIGGAVLTGIGLAGIGAGIAGQLHDPQVQEAAHRLSMNVKAGFSEATSSFAQPLAQSMTIFERTWDRLQPGLRQTFNQLAPEVTKLAEGAAGFGAALVPALERAAIAAKPLVEDFAKWLPNFGSQIAGLFDTISAHKDEALSGLHLIEGSLNDIVMIAQLSIPVLSKVTDLFSYLTVSGETRHIFGQAADDIHVSMGRAASSLYDAITATNADATAMERAAEAAQKLNTQMKDLFGTLMGVDQANLKWHQDLTSLVTQIDKSGASLDINTAAGQRNIETLLQLAQDAERVREAAIAQAGGQTASAEAVTAANAKYREQVGQLEALAVKLGLSKSAVQALLNKYLDMANAPDISKWIVIHGSYTSSGHDFMLSPDNAFYHGLATGAIVTPAARGLIYAPSNPPLIQFAEPQTDGEAYIPRRGIPAARGLALANTAAGWFGGSVVAGDRPTAGVAAMRFEGNLDSAFATAFLYLMRAGLITLYDSSGQRVTVG